MPHLYNLIILTIVFGAGAVHAAVKVEAAPSSSSSSSSSAASKTNVGAAMAAVVSCSSASNSMVSKTAAAAASSGSAGVATASSSCVSSTITNEQLLLNLTRNPTDQDNVLLVQRLKNNTIPADMCTPEGTPLIIVALIRGNFEAVRVILNKMPSAANQVHKDTLETPLLVALRIYYSLPLDGTQHFKVKTMVIDLLKYGAKVNVQMVTCVTPLMCALDANDKKMQELLLKHGAKIDFEHEEALKIHGNKEGIVWEAVKGDTPLIAAARFGEANAVNAFIKRGANVTHKNSQGQDAMAVAQKRCNAGMSKNYNEIIDLLRLKLAQSASTSSSSASPAANANQSGSTSSSSSSSASSSAATKTNKKKKTKAVVAASAATTVPIGRITSHDSPQLQVLIGLYDEIEAVYGAAYAKKFILGQIGSDTSLKKSFGEFLDQKKAMISMSQAHNEQPQQPAVTATQPQQDKKLTSAQKKANKQKKEVAAKREGEQKELAAGNKAKKAEERRVQEQALKGARDTLEARIGEYTVLTGSELGKRKKKELDAIDAGKQDLDAIQKRIKMVEKWITEHAEKVKKQKEDVALVAQKKAAEEAAYQAEKNELAKKQLQDGLEQLERQRLQFDRFVLTQEERGLIDEPVDTISAIQFKQVVLEGLYAKKLKQQQEEQERQRVAQEAREAEQRKKDAEEQARQAMLQEKERQRQQEIENQRKKAVQEAVAKKLQQEKEEQEGRRIAQQKVQRLVGCLDASVNNQQQQPNQQNKDNRPNEIAMQQKQARIREQERARRVRQQRAEERDKQALLKKQGRLAQEAAAKKLQQEEQTKRQRAREDKLELLAGNLIEKTMREAKAEVAAEVAHEALQKELLDAAYNTNINNMTRALQRGACIHESDKDGNTALHNLIVAPLDDGNYREGAVQAVVWLLARRPVPNIFKKNNGGESPYDLAKRYHQQYADTRIIDQLNKLILPSAASTSFVAMGAQTTSSSFAEASAAAKAPVDRPADRSSSSSSSSTAAAAAGHRAPTMPVATVQAALPPVPFVGTDGKFRIRSASGEIVPIVSWYGLGPSQQLGLNTSSSSVAPVPAPTVAPAVMSGSNRATASSSATTTGSSSSSSSAGAYGSYAMPAAGFANYQAQQAVVQTPVQAQYFVDQHGRCYSYNAFGQLILHPATQAHYSGAYAAYNPLMNSAYASASSTVNSAAAAASNMQQRMASAAAMMTAANYMTPLAKK